MATQTRPVVPAASMPIGASEAGAETGVGPEGVVARARRWLDRPVPIVSASSPMLRRLGVLWVCVSLPFITAASAFVHTRDVGGCQPDAAPQIALPCVGECADRIRQPTHIGAIDEPKTASQTLIESTTFVTLQMRRYSLAAQITGPVEKSFMKSIAIVGKHGQQRIQMSSGRSQTKGQPSKQPADPDMNHVGVSTTKAG